MHFIFIYLKSQVEISRLKKSEHIILKILFAFSTHLLTKYFTVFFETISFSLIHTHIFEWTSDPKENQFIGKDAKAPLG